jgi:hypothetical protein
MSLFSRFSFPTLPALSLSEDEQNAIRLLQQESRRCRNDLLLSEAFYLGTQVVENLRIAIPKELEFIAPTLGWGAMAVDPYVERLHADGFRLANATDSDGFLGDALAGSSFASEQSLAFTDALSLQRSYWCVGSGESKDDAPVVTVESPINTSVLWNLRGTDPTAVLLEYWRDGRHHGALMLPRKTIHMATNDAGEWVVVSRDEHGFDFVPIIRMANAPLTRDRDGRSAITPALRYNIQNACRTMLGLEVSREIYSTPGKILLGATEADFQNSDGTPKSAWDTYITKVLALERDADGNLPELKQLQPYDPSVFTKLLDWLASSSAGYVAAPPQDMGLYTQGNPASAEAVDAANDQRKHRAIRMQKDFEGPLVKLAQTVARFDNGGVLPDKYKRLEVDWTPVTLPAPGVQSDAVSKQVDAGSVPPTSDVVLKRLGYSRVERARLEQDRVAAEGQAALQQIADSVTAPPTAQEPVDGTAAGV